MCDFWVIMASVRTSSALRALAVEYKSLQEEPVEGFCVKLVNEDNLFEWEVAIFGPPDTLYMGGYFKVIILVFLCLQSFLLSTISNGKCYITFILININAMCHVRKVLFVSYFTNDSRIFSNLYLFVLISVEKNYFKFNENT